MKFRLKLVGDTRSFLWEQSSKIGVFDSEEHLPFSAVWFLAEKVFRCRQSDQRVYSTSDTCASGDVHRLQRGPRHQSELLTHQHLLSLAAIQVKASSNLETKSTTTINCPSAESPTASSTFIFCR